MRRWPFAAGFVIVAGATAVAMALAGGALGAGCTTPADMGSACGGGANATLAAFCASLATADCSPAIVAACGVSAATCVHAGTASCVKAHTVQSPCLAGCLAYDEEYAPDCIAAHQSVYTSASLSAIDYQVLASACLGVFNSGCLEATVCTSDADCDIGAGLVCVIQSGATGTCEVPSPVMAGSVCTGDPTAQCIDSTYCSDGGKCVADLGVCDAPDGGGCPRCSVSAPCYADVIVDAGVGDGGETFDVNGLRCSGGVCTHKLADGAACTDDGACIGGFCVSGACKTVYTFSPTTPPSTATAPGCTSFGAP